MANNSSNVVFVGNIPYNTTQQQIIQICQEIGPVVSFRLVTDKDTGRPKGYGFCQYKDEETALSARRNLNGCDINGRQLRVDFSTKGAAGGADSSNQGGPGFVNSVPPPPPPNHPRGPAFVNVPCYYPPGGPGFVQAPPHKPTVPGFVNAVPLQLPYGNAPAHQQPNGGGGDIQNNNAASDPLTVHLLNRYSPQQLSNIMSEMCDLATQNKELARQLLTTCPALPRAILQAHNLLAGGRNQYPPMT